MKRNKRYGRHRVGKTTFLKEFCKSKKHIFYSAEQSNEKLNLDKFSSLVADEEGGMGIYLNPGNREFAEKTGPDYVDKTGLISLINKSIGTAKKLTCISRPRRFGKSYAAQMLCAYYDKSCDSHKLFRNYEIAKDESYEEHINRYDVIYLDMTNLLGNVVPEQLTAFIIENVTRELLEAYPQIDIGYTFDQTLINAVEFTGNRFIMIVDEWDAPIRETPEIEKQYLRFLRMLFKSSGTTSKIFANYGGDVLLVGINYDTETKEHKCMIEVERR